jgi:hypothetical protein
MELQGAVVSGATAIYERISGPTFDPENEEYSQSRSSGRHEGGTGLGPTEEGERLIDRIQDLNIELPRRNLGS